MDAVSIWALWLLQLGSSRWAGAPPPPWHGGPSMAWPGLPNALGIAVWGLLLLLVSSRFRSGAQPPSRRLLTYGFAVGMAFQAVLLLAEAYYLHYAGWFRPRGVSYAFLIELGTLAEVLLIGGLLGGAAAGQVRSRQYVRTAYALLGVTLAAAIVEAAVRAATGGPQFGPMYSSFATLAAGLLVLVLGGVLAARGLTGASRWIALGAIGCFVLGDGIRFLGLAVGADPAHAFGPWSQLVAMPSPIAAIYSTDAGIVGALLIGFLFIRTHSAELRTDFTTLEERVQARTAELESAMENLAIANAKLVEQSTVDSLTGVGNRRHFDDAIDKAWALAAREARPIAVALIDIDHFKQINDRHGHHRGDECLVSVATVLQDGARRPADVLARFGGDEFVLLLPGVEIGGAQAVLDRARKEIEALGAKSGLNLTVSAGAAACVPAVGSEPEALLRAADESLYAAKHAGRNRVGVRVPVQR